jgi:excisionase family DNA binding protein
MPAEVMMPAEVIVVTRLFTLPEVGELLGGRDRSYVHRLIESGRLSAVKEGDGRRVRADALQAYIDSLEVAA